MVSQFSAMLMAGLPNQEERARAFRIDRKALPRRWRSK